MNCEPFCGQRDIAKYCHYDTGGLWIQMKTNRQKKRKRNYIFQYIRRSQLKRLPYPLVLLGISLFFAFHFFILGPLQAVPLPSSSVMTAQDLDSHPYISISASNLSYSGDDYMVNGHLEGHFYYTFQSGQCQFYILKPDGDAAADFISRITIHGKLVESEELYLQLVTNMASRLNLSQEQVRAMVSPVFISQPDFLPLRSLLFGLLLLFCILISTVSLLRMMFCLLFPTCTRAYRGLKKYGTPKKILANVEKELEQDCIIQTTDMALTNRYLIEFSEDLSAIVPLKAVIWAYKMGSIRRRFPTFRKTMRYTLNLVTIDGRHYAFKNKKKGDVVMIQEEMSHRYPNFFFGYSEEHEEMVRHIIKEWKSG